VVVEPVEVELVEVELVEGEPVEVEPVVEPAPSPICLTFEATLITRAVKCSLSVFAQIFAWHIQDEVQSTSFLIHLCMPPELHR